jgi:arginine deiminase
LYSEERRQINADKEARNNMERKFGVYSEVGKLKTVMVCRPGLAHQRLTPGNCHDLLFDDIIWVQEAQKDHFDFVLKMQQRGVEVLELHDLLAQTLGNVEARSWILDRRITANSAGRAGARHDCDRSRRRRHSDRL